MRTIAVAACHTLNTCKTSSANLANLTCYSTAQLVVQVDDVWSSQDFGNSTKMNGTSEQQHL